MFAATFILVIMFFATLAIVMRDHLQSYDRAEGMIRASRLKRRMYNAMRDNPLHPQGAYALRTMPRINAVHERTNARVVLSTYEVIEEHVEHYIGKDVIYLR